MKSIGGFLELELSQGNSVYHRTPLTYKNGRAAFGAFLGCMRPSKVFVPFYCCDTLLDPLQINGTPYEFYPINPRFEPEALPTLQDGEFFLYIDYFDLKRDYVAKLSELYADRLVVDATQAFFLKGDGKSWLFNSCRKFFGVPDGGYLYVPASAQGRLKTPTQENTGYVFDHLLYRFHGDLKRAYPLALENEALLDSGQVCMSKISRYLLSHVDYASVTASRRRNFLRLKERLGAANRFEPALDADSTPHYFPFLPQRELDKKLLWERGIYPPYLWRDCLERPVAGFTFERDVSSRLLPLAIDQRYMTDDMDFVADTVLELLRDS